MADSAVTVTSGTGTSIDTRTEGTNGHHRQVVVLGDPTTNAGVAPVDATAGLKVDLGADNDVTVAGVSTAAKQDTIIGHVDGIETSLTSIDGKITAVNTGAVVVSSSALPSGAATAAKQPALGTAGTPSADVITVQGTASMTALKVDGSAVTQPVSLTSTTVTGTVAVTQSGTWDEVGINDSGNSITVDYATTGSGTATGALRVELPTNGTGVIATVGAVTAITNALPAGTNAIGKLAANSGVDIGDVDVTSLTGSTVAHDSADSGNPHKMGARARTSEIAAVANDDRTDLVATTTGKLIIETHTNPENIVSGVTSAMTGTTSTSLIAAPAGSLRNYVTTLTVSNSHATVGTDIEIQDGSGGTTIWVIPAAAVYGGGVVTFDPPLRQPTAATALYVKNTTTGASTRVSANGYKAL